MTGPIPTPPATSGPPENPEHGGVYRDPTSGDLFTYLPDDEDDGFPWQVVDGAGHREWLADDELPAGLEEAEPAGSETTPGGS